MNNRTIVSVDNLAKHILRERLEELFFFMSMGNHEYSGRFNSEVEATLNSRINELTEKILRNVPEVDDYDLEGAIEILESVKEGEE